MQPEAVHDSPLSILHLEDSAADHLLVNRALQAAGLRFTSQRTDTLQDMAASLQARKFDLVLADYRLPGLTALDAWQQLSASGQNLPWILVSGAIGEAAAVDAIKAGIDDYVLKDDLTRLSRVVTRTLEHHAMRLAKQQADAELAASERRLAEFAHHLQEAIEQERAAIAREIHDDIGGSLAAIRFDLAWLERNTEGQEPQSRITSALSMLKHALGASQRIMLNLRPAILDQGIAAAIEWLAQEFERRTGVRTVFRSDCLPTQLDPSVQLAAYRTAQEALTNISKHASPRQVKIDLSTADNVLTLEVSDDGGGIRDGDRDKPTSFGLKGLVERARTVGGWIDVSSWPGRGTTVTLTIPLQSLRFSGAGEDIDD